MIGQQKFKIGEWIFIQIKGISIPVFFSIKEH